MKEAYQKFQGLPTLAGFQGTLELEFPEILFLAYAFICRLTP